jgi:hypothetical protein
MSQSTKVYQKLSYIIPVEQQNTRLINAIFYKPYSKTVYFMTFQLELAFNLNFEGLNSLALAGAKYNPTVKRGSI